MIPAFEAVARIQSARCSGAFNPMVIKLHLFPKSFRPHGIANMGKVLWAALPILTFQAKLIQSQSLIL